MPKARGFFTGSQVVQAAPERSLPQCGACGLRRACNTPQMPVAGSGARRVLFVGEAPGLKEDDKGLPFMDKPGQRLRRVLRALKFDMSKDGWATYAIACRPPKSRRPTGGEVVYCRPNLRKALEDLNPDVIVPLGGSAVQAVLGTIWGEGTGGIARWAGWRIPCHELNAWVCPTWDPGHILMEEDKVLDKQFKAHLRAAVALDSAPWHPGPPAWGQDVRRVTDPGKAARWLRNATQATTGAIAWDYETNMLKPDGPDARVVSCAVAWGRHEPERCIAFPWHGEAIEAMGGLIRSPVPKIASNLKFEDRWTRKEFGHRVRAWAWDTMLAAHVCDNRQAITSVKFQAFVRLGTPAWNKHIEPFLKTKGSAAVNRILQEIDMHDLLLYNGLDALLEFRVATAQIEELGYPLPWKV